MIKITGKLWLLILCLSLVIGIALFSPSKIEAEDGMYTTNQSAGIGGTVGTGDLGTGGNDGNSNGEPGSGNGDPKNAINEDSKSVDTFSGSYGRTRTVGNPVPKQISSDDPQPNPSSGIFHTVLMAIPWVLLVVCLGFIWTNIFSLKTRLRTAEEKLRTAEKQMEKFFPPGSEEDKNVSNEQSKTIEERLSELEETVSRLKEAVSYLLKENKKEQQLSESSRLHSSEIPANNQIIRPAVTPQQIPPFNKDIAPSATANKYGSTFEADNNSRFSPEKQRITAAFNKMMLDSAKLDEGSMALWELQKNFIKNFKVIAFKCVNSEERINHPEEQPRFVICQASEGTLWRIKLSDGTFAVLPCPREYESTAHFQGGMKELFKSDYKSGTYRKIEVVSPAIVKSDFSIVEQGVLHLAQ